MTIVGMAYDVMAVLNRNRFKTISSEGKHIWLSGWVTGKPVGLLGCWAEAC